MNDKKDSSLPSLATLLVVIALSMAAGFFIVYRSLVSSGNVATSAAVPASTAPKGSSAGTMSAKPAEVSPLKGLNSGELAAFLVHKTPRKVKDITFYDEAGKAYKLSDWKGKTVLLNLWATWCPPCRKEMPDLDAIQAKFGDQNFELIALSVDRGNLDKPAKFFKSIDIKKLKLYGGTASHKIHGKLGAPGLPTTLLIGKDGLELGRLVGPAHWASTEAFKLVETAVNLK